MKPGEIWTAVFSGDYGKPRPALVVQSDRVDESHPSILLCPITSNSVEAKFRVAVAPNTITGLHKDSKIMVDKLTALPKTKVRERVGRIGAEQFAAVRQTLLFMIAEVEYEDASC